jgi:hypothetical protein
MCPRDEAPTGRRSGDSGVRDGNWRPARANADLRSPRNQSLCATVTAQAHRLPTCNQAAQYPDLKAPWRPLPRDSRSHRRGPPSCRGTRSAARDDGRFVAAPGGGLAPQRAVGQARRTGPGWPRRRRGPTRAYRATLTRTSCLPAVSIPPERSAMRQRILRRIPSPARRPARRSTGGRPSCLGTAASLGDRSICERSGCRFARRQCGILDRRGLPRRSEDCRTRLSTESER